MLTFFPEKGGLLDEGGLIKGGGVIEDLRYASNNKSSAYFQAFLRGQERGEGVRRRTVSPFRFSLLLFFLETLDTQANKRCASKVELEYV